MEVENVHLKNHLKHSLGNQCEGVGIVSSTIVKLNRCMSFGSRALLQSLARL